MGEKVIYGTQFKYKEMEMPNGYISVGGITNSAGNPRVTIAAGADERIHFDGIPVITQSAANVPSLSSKRQFHLASGGQYFLKLAFWVKKITGIVPDPDTGLHSGISVSIAGATNLYPITMTERGRTLVAASDADPIVFSGAALGQITLQFRNTTADPVTIWFMKESAAHKNAVIIRENTAFHARVELDIQPMKTHGTSSTTIGPSPLVVDNSGTLISISSLSPMSPLLDAVTGIGSAHEMFCATVDGLFTFRVTFELDLKDDDGLHLAMQPEVSYDGMSGFVNWGPEIPGVEIYTDGNYMEYTFCTASMYLPHDAVVQLRVKNVDTAEVTVSMRTVPTATARASIIADAL
ncbi:hypothetical protein BH09SUM1_BH09SUM1_33570 [soil metagenome]